ncbi:AI-2E family transporter [Tranquillimonas alkanivorans]|uniref:Predicted PurR-regulated permease PerM n=1 Tax=Tranquillimonas alkanivorans TaxID=441119 RepID=A0A1I5QDB7_9RHOB|nr:AI-2E family transporter [Tranquillimonas alkanivorans]SFP44233.1 Predicted PurR-regulated permease PerM [Tranquillimonas alkanivorans]
MSERNENGVANRDAGTAQAKHLNEVRWLLRALVFLGTFTAIYFAQSVLMPVVLGLLVALTLSPPVRWLARRGVPRTVSAVLLVSGLVLGALAVAYSMSGPASTIISEAPSIGPRLERKMQTLMKPVEQMREASEQVQEATDEDDPTVQEVQVEGGSFATAAMRRVAGGGMSVIMALILSMFLLAGSDAIQLRIVNSLGSLHEKKKALGIVRGIERQISRYLGAITLINAGLGVCIGTALYFLGMPYAWLWGVAAFLLNFLPILGAMIGVLCSGVVAVLLFDTLGRALLVPAVYFLLTFLEGQFLTPMLVGRRLKINVVAVFLTVLFWGWLWGIPGALMAVPFLVLLKVICDHVPRLAVLRSFLSDETPGQPADLATTQATDARTGESGA